MKQHITKEQWLEITPEQQYEVLVPNNKIPEFTHVPPTIGQMIEFLGEGLEGMAQIEFHDSTAWRIIALGNQHTEIELCDALWEAVKDKLK